MAFSGAMHRNRLGLPFVIAFAACAPDEALDGELREEFSKLAASGLPGTINTDYGPMSVELDYIPGVVDCELGWYTGLEASLDAQAIAARTYLARHLSARGAGARIPIGPQFQCWRRAAHERSKQAAGRTAGLVMRYEGQLIYSNYVSGANRQHGDCSPPPPSAFGYRYSSWGAMRSAYLGGVRFYGFAWTHIFVTNNEGRIGEGVEPTIQNNRSAANRGALGQYEADCLASAFGYDALSILQHFYGGDIEVDLPGAGSSDRCEGLDYIGECRGGLLRWCEDRALREFDCDTTGQVCGWQDEDIGYNCLPRSAATQGPALEPDPPGIADPAPGDPAPADPEPGAAGDPAETAREDASAAGAVEEPDPCGGITYHGYCDCGVLVWCEDQTIQSYDCGARGWVCGWENDAIGFNCL